MFYCDLQVVFKYRLAESWFFTAADGSIKKKNKKRICNQEIFKVRPRGMMAEMS